MFSSHRWGVRGLKRHTVIEKHVSRRAEIYPSLPPGATHSGIHSRIPLHSKFSIASVYSPPSHTFSSSKASSGSRWATS